MNDKKTIEQQIKDRLWHHQNDTNNYLSTYEEKIYETFSSWYQKRLCPDGFDDEKIEDITNRLLEEHIDRYGLFFDDDTYERFTWYLEDLNIDDTKENRYLFVKHEITTGELYHGDDD